MAKYSKDLVKQISDLIASDSYTVAELCKKVGIHRSTFHEWEKRKPDFSDSIKKAKNEYNERLVVEARRSLMKKVRGYEATETKTVYGAKGSIRESTITTKHFQPDTAAVLFTLVNKTDGEFRHLRTVDAKVAMETKLGQLSEDQLNQVIDRVIDESAN